MPIPYTSKGWETRFGKFLKTYGTHKLAKELGISRAGLIMKVEKYGLDKRRLARAAGEAA